MQRLPHVRLGDSGLKVSKLGFGTVDFGIKSNNITPEEGSAILMSSSKLGIDFWDTSDDYGNHPHVAKALKGLGREKVVLSTKTNARNGREAIRNLKTSLKELDTDYVDIFLLHFVKSDEIDSCRRVIENLSNVKKAGTIKVLGLSAHSVAVANEGHRIGELDVLMTIYCCASEETVKRYPEHIPIEDGRMDEMLRAIELAHDYGKGVVAMKVLGTGAPPIVGDSHSSMRSIARVSSIDSVVTGMKKMGQVKKNVEALISCKS